MRAARGVPGFLILSVGILTGMTPRGAVAAPEDARRQDPKKESRPAESKATIAVFRLHGDVSELPPEESFSFGAVTRVSLKDLLARMRKAGADPAVKALVLLHEGGSIGRAQIEEVRREMAKIRAAGKEVFAHSEALTMHDYMLLSGASRLSVVPTTDVWVAGLYSESPYLRGLLDKIGVAPDFLTCGAYKSAAEMFMRDGPSPEAEAMQSWLLDSLFESAIGLIASGRNVAPAKVRAWVDNGPYTAEKALAAGLVDAVEHRQDFEALLRNKFGPNVVFDKTYGRKPQPKLDLSFPFAILKVWSELLGAAQSTKKATRPAVGIVYVDGAITLGSGQVSLLAESSASSTKIRKALDEAARDDSIKAVVLRINSPGGSASASEIILDATKRVKAKKPFTVSMGDVAGSGAYYVACAADVIFADESTITGSIGVVSGKLATAGMWKKAGVTFKAHKRGENAGLLSSGSVFTPGERARMQAMMDEVYAIFKGHVRSIRGDRLKKPLDELAGGRVFTGRQALGLGLVDRLGTLQDAVGYAAERAKLTDYDVRIIPAPKNFLEQLIEESSGDDQDKPGLDVDIHAHRRGDGLSLVELAMPFLRQLDPRRSALVRRALEQLQILHQEGLVLMMPELGMAR